MKIWAIVPVKPMRLGKSRLAHILKPEQRARLTGSLLSHTLQVLRAAPEIARTLVISRDAAALKIARRHGAMTFGEGEKQDLNLALMRAAHVAAAQHANGILVLPADLPFVSSNDVTAMVAAILPQASSYHGNGRQYLPQGMAICGDQQREGTNGLLILPPTGFTFHYGPGSFDAHIAEAIRLGLEHRIVEAPGLQFDIDTEADWRRYQALLAEKETLGEAV